MANEKETAKRVLDRLRAVTVPAKELFEDDVISSSHKRIYSYKTLEEILPRTDGMLGEANRALDKRQLDCFVECVNCGVFAREKLSSFLEKAIRGWRNSPKTIDQRIVKLMSMTMTGKLGNTFASAKKEREKAMQNGEKQREIDENPQNSVQKYAKIEDLGKENGFSDKFMRRIEEMKENYAFEPADMSILRLLVSSEIHMEDTQASQCKYFTAKRLKKTMMLLEVIRSCMEALKLTRKQRRVENDDSTERDIEKKYAENRSASKEISKEDAEVVERSKAAILEFSKESDEDDLDDEFSLCQKCMSIECDGSCSEEDE